jgi:hypothetical protein
MKSVTFSALRCWRPQFVVLALTLLITAGCTRVATRLPAALPVLPPLITAGARHYTIQSTGSDVRFLAYRAGPLAAFGHNHVIHATTINGDVYLNSQFSLSGFAFTLPLKDFQVDEPAERAAEGPDFAVQPSDEAIAGTTHNMLGSALLDEAQYPEIAVRSAAVTGPQINPVVTIRVTLRGVQRDIRIPISLAISGSQLTASGHFDIKQSDFGITPFSILGGGLQVADTVKVEFRIAAGLD